VRLVRTGLVAAVGCLALLALTLPASAANECDGLQVCVPVAGPWVVVPTSTTAARSRVEYQVTCPKGHIVAGLDARLSDPGIDVWFLGKLGSPVNPGISTSRSVVFVATYAGTRSRAPSFKPFVGCVPGGGRGGRVPTSVAVVPPGSPVTRRVKTAQVRPGSTTLRQSCVAGERLVGSEHAVGFSTRTAPSESLARTVSAVAVTSGTTVSVRVTANAERAGTRAVVQVQALCTRAK
jgi:hypothetical protein